LIILYSVSKKTPIYSQKLMRKVLRYACKKNACFGKLSTAHLRKVNSAFSAFFAIAQEIVRKP
jgi:hypothetical protein